MSIVRTRIAPVVLALVVPSLLTSCNAADTAAPTSAPTASAIPSPDPTVPPEVECLERGTWVVDNVRETELFTEGMGSVSSDFSAEVTGETTWVFSEGTLTRTFTAWQRSFSATFAVAGAPHVTESMTWDGATTAAYEASATDVATEAADISGLTVDVVATENGEPVTFDDPDGRALESEESPQSWAFTCENDTLLLTDRLDDGSVASESSTTLLHRR